MPEPSVRRIQGLNLRVRDLPQAVAYYTHAIGLKTDRVFGKEAFLRWTTQGQDFLGLFVWQTPGWHHVELRLWAPDATTALHDLQLKSLIERLHSVGSSEVSSDMLRRWVTPEVETFRPLVRAPLVAELSDPDGRMLELVYLKEDYTATEVPGLLTVEIQTSTPDAVAAFYSQVGFVHTPEGLIAASGQRLLISGGKQLEWVRATLVVSRQDYIGLTKLSRRETGALSLMDPNGYELRVLPEGGVTP